MRYLTIDDVGRASIALLPLVLVTAGFARAAQPVLAGVRYTHGQVSIAATSATVGELVDEIARQAGAVVTGATGDHRVKRLTFENVEFGAALERLVRPRSFLIVYGAHGQPVSIRMLAAAPADNSPVDLLDEARSGFDARSRIVAARPASAPGAPSVPAAGASGRDLVARLMSAEAIPELEAEQRAQAALELAESDPELVDSLRAITDTFLFLPEHERRLAFETFVSAAPDIAHRDLARTIEPGIGPDVEAPDP